MEGLTHTPRDGGSCQGALGWKRILQESWAMPDAGMGPWQGSLTQREAVGKLGLSHGRSLSLGAGDPVVGRPWEETVQGWGPQSGGQ